MTNNPNLNWLSLARCFLFASRDFWFEVPLPFFLRSPSCLAEAASGDDADAAAAPSGDGCGGPGWERWVVGAVLGGYIIVYGQCQSWSPQLVLQPLKQSPPNKLTEIVWGLVNCVPTAVMAGASAGCKGLLNCCWTAAPPAARLVRPRAQGTPVDPGAPPQPLGSVRWPPELASARAPKFDTCQTTRRVLRLRRLRAGG